jgi:cytochrome bd-type quinol oxidase subunit 2
MAAIILVEIMRIQYSMQYDLTVYQYSSATIQSLRTVYCILQLVIIYYTVLSYRVLRHSSRDSQTRIHSDLSHKKLRE